MAKLSADEIYSYAVGAGFSPDEAVTMTAIALAESGGNTNAHNPNGEDSRGLWQVNMRAHSSWVGSKNLYDPATAAWAAYQVYKNAGNSISPWTVTHKKNNYMYRKHEAAAQQAAVNAGYEGMVGNFSGVEKYGVKVNAGSPEGATPSGGAPGGAGTPEDIEAEIRENYPEFAFMLDDPEIRKVLLEAADPEGGLDDAAFMARIRNTKWYQTNGSNARQWEAIVKTDPATAARTLDSTVAALRSRANAMGVDATDEQLRELADRQLRYNLNDAEMSTAFAELMVGDAPAGAVATTMTQLRAEARKFMVNVDENELVRWARGLVAGTTTIDNFATGLQSMAKAKFSGNDQMVQMIDQGMSPDAFFADHRRLIAGEWDMSPEQVDLLDTKWQGVLQISGDNGKIRPMTLDETRRHIRSMAGWDKTTAGREKISNTTTMLLEKFGKVAY